MFTKKAFLFDMDGVLVDNCAVHTVAWLEFARRHGGHLTERQVLDWMGAPGRDYLVRMFDAPLSEAQITAYMREKESLYREMYRPHLALREGLAEVFAAAKQKGILCAVVTGGSKANVDFVLDGLGIRDNFTTIVDASAYEKGKPAPDCYLQGAARLGVRPEDCLVFEDAVNGIESARAARMTVIAITGTNPRTTLEAAQADRVIDSFRELM